MEMDWEDPVGSINRFCVQSGVYPGLKRGVRGLLYKPGWLLSQSRMEKVALLWSPCIISHSKWQPSAQTQMPTDARVSARGVFVCVLVFLRVRCVRAASRVFQALCHCRCESQQRTGVVGSQITQIRAGRDLGKLFKDIFFFSGPCLFKYEHIPKMRCRHVSKLSLTNG